MKKIVKNPVEMNLSISIGNKKISHETIFMRDFLLN